MTCPVWRQIMPMAPYDSHKQEKVEIPIAFNLKWIRKTHPKPACHVALQWYFLQRVSAFHFTFLPHLLALSRIWVSHPCTH